MECTRPVLDKHKEKEHRVQGWVLLPVLIVTRDRGIMAYRGVPVVHIDDFSRMLPVFKHALEQLRIEVTRD